MTVTELIAKLQEFARHTPDAPVMIYDGKYPDDTEVETVGCWAVYDDDNVFVVLNHPEDSPKPIAPPIELKPTTHTVRIQTIKGRQVER